MRAPTGSVVGLCSASATLCAMGMAFLGYWGVHEPVFLRAIVRLRTEDGLEGVGEGPGGALYVQQLRAAARHVIGADAFHLESLRVLVRDQIGRASCRERVSSVV